MCAMRLLKFSINIMCMLRFLNTVYLKYLISSQGMSDLTNATKYYKDVLHEDNMNIEAIACIGTHYFYSDQPEIALKFYRYNHIHVQNDFCVL